MRNSRLQSEVLEDLLRHTNFTPEEILEWHKKFSNVCPNGHLTIEEFKSEFSKTFPDGDASKFAEHVYRTFDANGDGIIDFREYLTALYITSRGRIEQKLKLAFTLYDIDGNGYISCDEMQEVLKSVHKAMGFLRAPADEAILKKGVSVLFKQIDRNMDGKVHIDELIESVHRHPNILKQLDPMS